jgi:hypothetical protein
LGFCFQGIAFLRGGRDDKHLPRLVKAVPTYRAQAFLSSVDLLTISKSRQSTIFVLTQANLR